jgi:hypothetical protein
MRLANHSSPQNLITNSWTGAAVGNGGKFVGYTDYSRDVNGNVVSLTRSGRHRHDQTTAYFTYDSNGQILTRTDKPIALASERVLIGSNDDPRQTSFLDEWGQQLENSAFQANSDAVNTGASVHNYVYGLNHPLADLKATYQVTLKVLALQGGTAVYGPSPGLDIDGNPIPAPLLGYTLALTTADIVTDASTGAINRLATAQNLAARAYGTDFSALSTRAQADVVAYVQSQLPASDAAVIDGASIDLYAYLQIGDVSSNNTLTTDYSFERIGGVDPNANKNGVLDGNLQSHEPFGTLASHSVHAGDTLQSMASMYYGSSSYWYLIADANGLQGTETLKEGTTLTIPNRVTNSFNTFDTFRPYSANDILGNTTPGLRFKMGLYQQWERAVVTIVSIIVMVVVAIYAPALLGVVGGLLAGFFIGYAVSVAGQSSNVDAGLQTKVDYKQARKMGYSLAISVLAADFLSWAQTGVTAAGTATGDAMTVAADATTAEEAASAADNIANALNAENTANQLYQVERVAIEAGKQMLQNHGKITSVTGLVGAYFGADVSSGWAAVGMAGLQLGETYSRNKHQLNNLDWMHFATSAVGGYYGSTYDSNGMATGTQSYFRDAQGNNTFNWAMLAREAAFTGLNAFAASRVKSDQDSDRANSN